MLNVVGLSGGKDSTALAFLLKEREPETDWTYICTPTGAEGPEMVEHWLKLEEALEKPLIRIKNPKAPSLNELIDIQKMVPNHAARHCTRILKIEPTIAWCVRNAPVLMHVGLRADENEREGIYGDLVQSRVPFREIKWGLPEVLEYCRGLARRFGIVIPARTDCLECYAQKLVEWWNFWRNHSERFWNAAAKERKYGHSFRSPKRDTWPAFLEELGAEFQRLWDAGHHTFFEASNARRIERGGFALKVDKDAEAACRVCSL